MNEKQVSSTAILATMLRAIHQTIDSEPKVLIDPVSILLAKEFEKSPEWIAFDAVPEQFQKMTRAALILRSRYAEDILKEAVSRGKCQYVILGAGFDTFAYRQSSWARAIRIFEVDLAATQQSKRAVLQRAAIAAPENLRYCPVDFQSSSLRDALAEASFEFHIPSVFSWLGVTQYLSKSAIQATLQFIQSLPKSSTVVFSFVPSDPVLIDEDRQLITELGRVAAARGEPFLSRFDPEELQQLLYDIGFSSVYHLLPAIAQERYFAGRTDGLTAQGVEQLMRATT
jgi:methyltransferase (TIGR00027 family)